MEVGAPGRSRASPPTNRPAGPTAGTVVTGTLEVLAPDGNSALSVIVVESEVLGPLRERVTEKGELIALTGCYLHLDSEGRDAGLVQAAAQENLVGARIPAHGKLLPSGSR